MKQGTDCLLSNLNYFKLVLSTVEMWALRFFFYVSLNKLLKTNRPSGCWFEAPWHSCDVIVKKARKASRKRVFKVWIELRINVTTLQWRHMGVMASEIIGNSTRLSITCSAQKRPTMLDLLRGIHRSLENFCKGPTIHIPFPGHEILIGCTAALDAYEPGVLSNIGYPSETLKRQSR